MFGDLWRKLQFLWQKQRYAEDLEEEMRLHAELRARQLSAQGVPPNEAKRIAHQRFGNRTSLQEKALLVWSFPALENGWRDLGFALRLLRKQPVFTLAAVVSLGLGLGVNTAVFTLLNALAFRPLPVPHPQQLVRIGSLKNNGLTTPIPGPVLEDLRKDPGLQGVCGFTAGDAIVEIDGHSSALATHSLTGDCYQTLGVHPALGRLLTPADDIPNGPHVAVLGYAFWQEKWGGRPNVLGQTIRIGGKAFQIIGVTESRFQGLLWGFPPSVSAPISQRNMPNQKDPAGRFYWADTLARLQPGIGPTKLEADLQVKWRRLLDHAIPATFAGANRDELLRMPPVVTSAATGLDYYYRDHFQPSLTILLTISAVVLLASCLNVANLLLARGWQRQREMAIRLAIGAPRRRILQQLFIESALLIAAGLGAAMGLSLWTVRIVVQTFAHAYGRSDLVFDVPVDGHVLLFVAVLASLVLLLAGVLPAWQTSDVRAAGALKSAARSLVGGLVRRRRVLLSTQIALTLIVLIGAQLFSQLLRSLQGNSLRFSGDQLFNAQLMPLPGGELDGPAAVQYFQNLLRQVKNTHGVDGVSLASFAPLVSSPYKEDIRRLDQSDRAVLQAPAEFVTEDFLRLLHIPLLQGRSFRDTDRLNSPRVAVISQSVAQRLFPSENPIGQHIQFGTEPETRDVQVIGIAADSPLEDPHTRDQGFVLLSLWQLPRMGSWGNLQVQFSGAAAPVGMALRDEVRQKGHQEIFLLRTIADLREMALLQERLLAAVGKLYSVLALVLAIVGLFGLLTFLVATRESELALRMALGAECSDVSLLVLREALWLVGWGVLAGLPLSLAAARVTSTALYGVSSLSIGPILLSVLILSVAALAAACGPIWRATSLNPNLALRQE